MPHRNQFLAILVEMKHLQAAVRQHPEIVVDHVNDLRAHRDAGAPAQGDFLSSLREDGPVLVSFLLETEKTKHAGIRGQGDLLAIAAWLEPGPATEARLGLQGSN